MGFVYLVYLLEEVVIVLQVGRKVANKWRKLVINPFRNVFVCSCVCVCETPKLSFFIRSSLKETQELEAKKLRNSRLYFGRPMKLRKYKCTSFFISTTSIRTASLRNPFQNLLFSSYDKSRLFGPS